MTIFLSWLTVSAAADVEETGVTTDTSETECPLGCISCSRWNGCIECATNFTWHIKKIFMRKIGICVRSCPVGYFRREFHYAPGHYRCEGKWHYLVIVVSCVCLSARMRPILVAHSPVLIVVQYMSFTYKLSIIGYNTAKYMYIRGSSWPSVSETCLVLSPDTCTYVPAFV